MTSTPTIPVVVDTMLTAYANAGLPDPFRTDLHYHVTFTVDANGVSVQYSHE